MITADGTVIAESVPSRDQFKYQRVYPDGQLFAGVTGFYNLNFGADGLERSYNDELAGKSDDFQANRLGDLFTNANHTGTLHVTIRKDVQQIAKDALGTRKGAVVAIEPMTGKVLALWSYPSFDPNTLSSHSRDAASAKQLLDAAPDQPLLPRSYRARYFPG